MKRETIRRKKIIFYWAPITYWALCLVLYLFYPSALYRGKIFDGEASIPGLCASSEYLLPVDHPAPNPVIKIFGTDPFPKAFPVPDISLCRDQSLLAPPSPLKSYSLLSDRGNEDRSSVYYLHPHPCSPAWYMIHNRNSVNICWMTYLDSPQGRGPQCGALL